MNIIRMKIRDIIAFRLLLIFQIVFASIIVTCFCATKQLWDIPTYIFGGMILICAIVQLILLTRNNYIEFSNDAVVVFFNKKEYEFSWEDISNPIHYSSSDMLLLQQNTLDFYIRDENGFVPFFRKFDNQQIYCNKKQFNHFYELFISSKAKTK